MAAAQIILTNLTVFPGATMTPSIGVTIFGGLIFGFCFLLKRRNDRDAMEEESLSLPTAATASIVSAASSTGVFTESLVEEEGDRLLVKVDSESASGIVGEGGTFVSTLAAWSSSDKSGDRGRRQRETMSL